MWDLGPLRPWEYWQMPADDWEIAVALRRAYDEGVADAKDEAAAQET